MKTINRKPLPRPSRRPKMNLNAPISFLPSCRALGLAWPTGKNVPTLAEAQARPGETNTNNSNK